MTKQNKAENWEEEFDKLYKENAFRSKEVPYKKYRTKLIISNAIHPEKIKSFIKQVLEDYKAELLGKIEKMEKTTQKHLSLTTLNVIQNKNIGYNSALQDIKNLIDNEKN